MAVKNLAVSTLARIKNQSKQEGISNQLGQQLFFQEEFLRRLSKSKYRNNMILKGGMFVYTLTLGMLRMNVGTDLKLDRYNLSPGCPLRITWAVVFIGVAGLFDAYFILVRMEVAAVLLCTIRFIYLRVCLR